MPKPRTRSEATLTQPAIQILLSLVAGRRHGYGIKLDIEERTGGAVELGSGTLYQALHRLESRGLIVASSQDGTDARRGREYRLTEKGRVALDGELEIMRRTLSYADAQPAPSTART